MFRTHYINPQGKEVVTYESKYENKDSILIEYSRSKKTIITLKKSKNKFGEAHIQSLEGIDMEKYMKILI